MNQEKNKAHVLDFKAKQNEKEAEQGWRFFINETLPYIGEVSMNRLIDAMIRNDEKAFGLEIMRASFEAMINKMTEMMKKRGK